MSAVSNNVLLCEFDFILGKPISTVSFTFLPDFVFLALLGLLSSFL